MLACTLSQLPPHGVQQDAPQSTTGSSYYLWLSDFTTPPLRVSDTQSQQTSLGPISPLSAHLTIKSIMYNYLHNELHLFNNSCFFKLFLLFFLSIIISSIKQLLCKCTLLNTCGTFGTNLQGSSLQPLLLIL